LAMWVFDERISLRVDMCSVMRVIVEG